MIHYFNGNGRFYRLRKTADPRKGGDEVIFENDGREIEYDGYSLVVNKVRDPYGNETAVITDYQAMRAELR